MGWDNSFQTIIILPSGATTGQRIVIDGQNGLVLVYDSINDLIASISPDNTTDSQGNTILHGITSYETGGHEYASLFNGSINVGRYGPDAPAGSQSGYFATLGNNTATVISSSQTDAVPDQMFMEFWSGLRNSKMGDADYPHAIVDGDVWVPPGNAAVIASILPNGTPNAIPETWHVVGDTGEPSFGSGWTSASSSGTYQPLQYRLDAEDNVYLSGVFHATTASPGSGVFTLPEANGSLPTYRPKIAQRVPVSTFATSGTESSASSALVINDVSSGLVRLVSSAAVAAGTNFAVSAKIPLGQLP